MDGPTLFIDVALSLLVFLNVVLLLFFLGGGGYIFLTSQVWNIEILKYHYKMY